MLLVPCAGAGGAGFPGLAVVWEGVKRDQSFSCGQGFPPVTISCGLSLSNESWLHAIAVPLGGFATVQDLWAAETVIPDWATDQKW